MLDTPCVWCYTSGMKGANMKYEDAFAQLLNDLWIEGQKAIKSGPTIKEISEKTDINVSDVLGGK